MRSFSILLVATAFAGAQTQSAPQRTMVSSPPGTRSATSAAQPAPDSQDEVVAKYREMWRNMGPAQQKAFVDSGGQTPEQYERALKQNAPPRPAVDPTMDSLNKSLQDLDAIRDGNLGRVQKDGCPPEVASRIADLKGKLQSYEAELNGMDATASARPAAKADAGDPLALAGDWYKRAGEQQPAPRDSRESKLLEDVLAGGKPKSDPKSPEAAQKRKATQDDIARTKAEIEQLSGACAASGKK